MSGLGELASVIAVLQLSGKIVDYVGKVKDASEDRKRLRGEIRACKRILQELKDDAEDIDEGESLVDTINVLERLDGPLPRLQTILQQVEIRLRHDNTLRGSLKWPFQEKDVQKLIQSIEREKILINLALSRDSRKLLREIKECAEQNNRDLALLLQSMDMSASKIGEEFCKLNDHMSQIQTLQVGLHHDVERLQSTDHHRESSKKRDAVLQWLSTYDHASKHHDILSKRQEGTGNWFLESKAYDTWLDNSSARKLLCTGLPGAGKPMLASIIIDDLQTRFQTKAGVAVAYFYCDYRTRDEQTLEFMLCSLLKVLAESQETLPIPIEQLYSDHGNGVRRPSWRILAQCLKDVAALLQRLYVVIDALDECQVSDGCRRKFLSELLNLQAKSRTSLLATSRTVPEVLAEFGAEKPLEVRASSDDVRKYVVGNLNNMPQSVQRNVELQELIKLKIVESVDGM
ncbi:hypothetical protein J4E93_010439 [Alternaria ventricosa]|uniref:uncharacterized protein n=1 Tax=Alternaria ventricosa TaxID=1187951 RepID=UPI0020C33048|nr:uncharacterized protein J4E93_010439 [Alternaria ventricosa]KAI4638130.1 hypothetical protein J4E93_010439 [Alternaria ventricosa]